jgi:hypothetical protein
MNIHQPRPWPAIDLAELRYGIAFGLSVKGMADFLQRDVEDVRQKLASQTPLAANAPKSEPHLPGVEVASDRAGPQTDWIALAVPRRL